MELGNQWIATGGLKRDEWQLLLTTGVGTLTLVTHLILLVMTSKALIQACDVKHSLILDTFGL